MSINLVEENNILRKNVADLQKQLQDSFKKIDNLTKEKTELEIQLQKLQQ